MDKTEFNKQWEELKKGKNFCRMQSTSNVLSILSYKWSQVSSDPELGKEVWEGINSASYEMTKVIKQHIPSQEQQHVFGVMADIINYTFLISEHEKDRKDAKQHSKNIIDSTVVAIAHAREGKARITKIKREVVREILDQVWEKNPNLNGNVRVRPIRVRHVENRSSASLLEAVRLDNRSYPYRTDTKRHGAGRLGQDQHTD